MALTSKQRQKLGEVLQTLKGAFEDFKERSIGNIVDQPSPPAGSIETLKDNHSILQTLHTSLLSAPWLDPSDGAKDFEEVWPITIADLANFGYSKSVTVLDNVWETETLPQIDGYLGLLLGLDPDAKMQLDNKTEEVYGNSKVSKGNVTAVEEIIDLLKQFVNEFGVIAFARKNLPDPSLPSSEADIIMVDLDLENSLEEAIKKSSEGGHPTHYVGLLEDPKTSNGERSNPYLPVRLAPALHPTPLKNGWDDSGYCILQNQAKLTGAVIGLGGYFEVDGIEIQLGTGINIVEIVLSATGTWVGFVTAKPGHEAFKEYTKEESRVLYTRPKYIRRLNSAKVAGGSNDVKYVDPMINHTMISIDTPNARAAILGDLGKGVNLVSDKNLNWTGMKYGDVQFAYYNFNEGNADLKLPINSNTITTTNRLRLSEGYYYFVAIDGSRPSVGDLLNVISIPPTGDPNSAEKIITAKKAAASDSIKTGAVKALDMILEYNGKMRPKNNHEWFALRDIWTVLVAKHKKPHAPKGNNEKLLFAIPASIIEALPNTERPYQEQFEGTTPGITGGNQPQSDFYTDFGEGGKTFVFTLKLADLKKTTNDLVKVLTKIKGRFDDFKSTGGVVKNQNNINYNIDSQIERIQGVPDIFGEFLKRQSAPRSPDRDYITTLLGQNGLQQKGEAFIQVGIRSNKEIGFGARYTVAFVLFSPDPEVMKTAPSDKTELRFLDPYITEDELDGKRDASRSAIALTRALPWLRNQFIDVEGSRTLHYFFAHRNMITFHETIKQDFSSNNWVKFLQAYTVPPLAIKLSADRAQDPEEIDCKKLIEQLKKSASTISETDKKTQELIEKHCGTAYLEEMLKKTSASDPESSRHGLHMKQLLSKNVDALGDAAFSYDTLFQLYDGFLHKLDVNGLIALLIACLQKKYGIPATAREICREAILKLVEWTGVDEIKKQILIFMPELAIFLGVNEPELVDMSGFQQTIQEVEDSMGGKTYTHLPPSDEFVYNFKKELVQNPALEGAPIAVALSERVLDGKKFAVGFPLDKNDGSNQRMYGATSINLIADLERKRIMIPLEPFWIDPYHAYSCWNPDKLSPFSDCMDSEKTSPIPRRFTLDEIAAQNQTYIDAGYSPKEARACLVRDGFVEVSPNFLRDTVVDPPDIGNMITTSANALTDLGKTFLTAPPSPEENAGNVSWAPTTTGVGNALSKADEARKFVAYLEKIVDLQQLCEGLVGAMMELPGMMFTRPSDFVNTWKNWWDNLWSRLERQFRYPEDSIPSVAMPDTLPTDDLIKDYADKLIAAFATMTGMILGEILNMILKDYLEKCLLEDETEPGYEASGNPLTIPLPLLEDVAKNIEDPEVRPDFVAWLRAVIDYLNSTQLCNMLQGTAGALTLEQILQLTKDEWPLVWNSGIDNAADIKQIFLELGSKVDLRICDAIQAIEPILLDACDAGFDWDARCAELQMGGLTKEECDEQIKKELDDLRNKIGAMAGFMFPDANPLDGALPHPCGPNGYFQLPMAMKNTMASVTDNFLKGVKASVIRDLQGTKFMSMPPRGVELMNDPEELIETHRLFNEAIEDKIEKLTLMPVVFDMAAGAQIIAQIGGEQTTEAFEKHKAENFSNNILTYTVTHGPYTGAPAIRGYSRAGVEMFEEEEVYKAVPHKNDLQFYSDEASPGRTEPLKNLKPKSLLNVGHLNSDIRDQSDFIPDVGKTLSRTFLSKKFINSVASGYSPWYPGNHMARPLLGDLLKSYAEELYKFRFGEHQQTDLMLVGTKSDGRTAYIGDQFHNLEDVAPQLAEDMNSILRGDKKSESGIPEPQPKGLHRKVVGYHQYKALRTAKSLWEYAYSSDYDALGDSFQPFNNVSMMQAWARPIAYEKKYRKMYRLDQKVRDLLPPEKRWEPTPTTKATLLSFGVNIDVDVEPYYWGKAAFVQLFANFVGIDIADIPDNFFGGESHNTIKVVMGRPSYNNLKGPQKRALEVIKSYAKGSDMDFMDAFGEMPIGVAVGLEKHILRWLYPRWWGLWESIEEEGGVIFDLEDHAPTEIADIYPQLGELEPTEDFHGNPKVWNRYAQLRVKFVVRKDFYRDPDSRLENITPDSPFWPKPNNTSKPVNKKFVSAFDDTDKLGMKETFPPALYKKTSERLFAQTLGGFTHILEDNKFKQAYVWDVNQGSFKKGKFIKKWKTEPTYVYYVHAAKSVFQSGHGDEPRHAKTKTDLIEYYKEFGFQKVETWYHPTNKKYYIKLWEGFLKAGDNGIVEAPEPYPGSPHQINWYLNIDWRKYTVSEGEQEDETELTDEEKMEEMEYFDYYLYSNFNPSVAYWPMPFKNPAAIGSNINKIEETVAGIQNILGADSTREIWVPNKGTYVLEEGESIPAYNIEHSPSADPQENTWKNDTGHKQKILITKEGLSKQKAFAGAFNVQGVKNNTLLYQDFPIEVNQEAICKEKMKDCYKVAKGKLIGKTKSNKGFPSPHNVSKPIDNSYQVAEPEFDYEITQDYDSDVITLLKKIGIYGSDDCKKVIQDIKSVSTHGKIPSPMLTAPHTVYKGYNTALSKGDSRNYNQAIFAQLMTYKLDELIKKYGNGGAIDEGEKNQFKHFLGTYDYASCKMAYSSKIFGKLRLSRLNQRKFMNQLWNKVLSTPLTDKPMDPRCLNKLQELAVGTTSNFPEGVETDFFDIDTVKPEILDFYEKSVCADVYGENLEDYTAAQKALIEGAIILLIRVYTLELCLAGIISWDAYNIEDVFKEPIMTRLLVDNIKKDIDNMDLLYFFVNDIVSKKENIQSSTAHVILSGISGIEYIMREEAGKINDVVAKIFRFRNPISTDLSLNMMTSTDAGFREQLRMLHESPQTNFQWHPSEFETHKLAEDGLGVVNPTVHSVLKDAKIDALATKITSLSEKYNLDYSSITFLNDNIYTHNYGLGRLENNGYHHAPYLSNWEIRTGSISYHVGDNEYSTPQTYVYGGSPVGYMHSNFPTQDFSGNESRYSQRNFLHSVPADYSTWPVAWPGLLADEQELDIAVEAAVKSQDPSAPNTEADVWASKLFHTKNLHDHKKKLDNQKTNPWNLSQRKLADRLMANAGQFENKHEYLVGNNLNARMGNFIFQTYVVIEDQDEAGRKKYKARHLANDPTKPCDLNLEDQGSIVEAHVELGDGPVLQAGRHPGVNPVGTHLYGVVPLEAFSWFINHSFFPWINKSTEKSQKLKLLFNAHGFKPFFKSIKMGIRMTYVSNFGTVVQSSLLNTTDPANDTSIMNSPSLVDYLDKSMGVDGYKRSKSGVCQRTYMLADYQYLHSNSEILEDYASKTANIYDLPEGATDAYKDPAGTSDGENTTSLSGDWWPQVFNEIHIPVVEIEKEIEIDGGQVKVGNNYYDFNEFSYNDHVPKNGLKSGLGWDSYRSSAIDVGALINAEITEDVGDIGQPVVKGPPYEKIYRSVVQNPSNFYYKHLASDMLRELQNSPEFKLVFSHLIPVRRYMALGFLYSSDAILEILGDPTKIMEEAKETIISMLNGILDGSNDYTFVPEAVRNQLKNELMALVSGTSPKPGKSMRKRIMEIIWRAMLLVLRGFVELTDPAISIAQKIIDTSRMVYEMIIMTAEQVYYAMDAGVQQAIDVARAQIQQFEMTIHMGKVALDPGLSMMIQNYPGKVLNPEAVAAGTEEAEILPGSLLKEGGAKFNFVGDDLKNWKVDYDPDFEPAKDDLSYKNDNPMSGEWTTKWNDFKKVADDFNEIIGKYTEAVEELERLEKKKEYYRKEFGEKVDDIKEYMAKVFGSKFLLPGMWAAMLPSMTPYLGGIIPPPWFIGPPSTIPGMIYLVLLMGDAYDALDDEESEDSEKSWQEKCAEQL